LLSESWQNLDGSSRTGGSLQASLKRSSIIDASKIHAGGDTVSLWSSRAVLCLLVFGLASCWAQDYSPLYETILATPGNSPTGITLDWLDHYLWFVDSETRMLYKVDSGTGQVKDTIPSPCTDPEGVAFGTFSPSSPGNLWVVGYNTSQMYRIYLRGMKVEVLDVPAGNLSGIAFDPSRNGLWLSDRDTGMIHLISFSGKILSSIASPFPNPTGLSWQDSCLWVSSQDPSIVAKVDITDGRVLDWIDLGSENVSGVCALGPFLWVLDPDKGQVKRINTRQASFTGEPLKGEEPLTVRFSSWFPFNPSEENVSWIWNFGDGSRGKGPLTHHTYLHDGNYTVSLIVIKGLETHFGQRVGYVTVTDRDPRANFRVQPGMATEGPPPLTVTFNDISWSHDGVVRRFWDFGDRSGSSEEDPTHTYRVPGAYNVSLTIFEADGDSDTMTRTRLIVVSETLFTRPVLIIPTIVPMILYAYAERNR